MLSFEPTDDERAIQEEVRKFAEAELRRLGRECERARAAPEALRRTYADLGLATIDWPEAWGGAGLSTVARALVEEELGWGDAGLALALDAPGFGALAVRELASPEEAARWLPRFAKAGEGGAGGRGGGDGAGRAGGGGGAALALEEVDLGAPLGHFATVAEPAPGGNWRLSGRKLFVWRADVAETFVVAARAEPDGLPRAFVVERGAPGLSLGREDDRTGLLAARSFEVRLDGVPVPREAALGPPAPGAWDRFLARLWTVNAARQVGIARAATEYAIYYAQERAAFGKKIGQFQGIAFKIAEMAMETDAARWLVWRAARAIDAGADAAEAARRAAIAAVHANEAAVRAAIDCVQVLGGAGYMEDYPAEKWMRDARALAQIGGSDPLRNHLAAERVYGPGEWDGPPGAGASASAAAAFAAFAQAFGGGSA